MFWLRPDPVEYQKDCIVISDSEEIVERGGLWILDQRIEISVFVFGEDELGEVSSDILDDIFFVIGDPNDQIAPVGVIIRPIEASSETDFGGVNCVKRTLILQASQEINIYSN
ncbi:MAG: hypothetical protein HC840_04950 [Leptolyngbyaceae cyanobacterium RM2_2_4]|nr:hypothetical protein [Leptolyngbyaceae cyanobacterium RM2_2_4]